MHRTKSEPVVRLTYDASNGSYCATPTTPALPGHALPHGPWGRDVYQNSRALELEGESEQR